jgi:hypothetical protein
MSILRVAAVRASLAQALTAHNRLLASHLLAFKLTLFTDSLSDRRIARPWGPPAVFFVREFDQGLYSGRETLIC